jgi:branched-chain amino acid transport system ATP-binding protein
MKAIDILHDEHRSLAAVLQGMRHLVREIDAGRIAPDFRLFDAMLYYIDAFPERFHHPREDEYLFRRVLARAPAAAPIVTRLESEHREGAARIRALAQSLERYRAGGGREFAAVRDAVDDYAGFHWKHMRAEEDELLPLARAHLTADDWRAVDAGFATATDPLHGAGAAEYDALFRRIVTLAPPPIGVGPAP